MSEQARVPETEHDDVPEGPEVLAAFTEGRWARLSPSGDTDEGLRLAGAHARSSLSTELQRILVSENLAVLAGLGTSLGIEADGSGNRAPSMNDLWAAIEGIPEFTAATGKLSPRVVEGRNFEHLLSDAQARLALDPDDTVLKNFVAAAEDIVWKKCAFVGPNTSVNSHEIFLRKVARRSVRLQRAQLFTTNYDLAFELAAERTHFNVIDGFGFGGAEFDGGSFDLDYVRRRPNEQLALEPSVLHILKLHGSVDWSADGAIVRKVRNARPSAPVLIYPSAAKYQLSYQQPYLEFMSRFQISLRQPELGLIIVGFGFNDEHIFAPFEAALRSNVGLRAVIVTPGARDRNRARTIRWIEELIARGDRRLTIIKATFDDLVRFLPDAPDFEERQAHLNRLVPGGTEQ